MEHIVGIGGCAVSGNGADVIKTFALSTCVGMVFYSVRKRCMGMAHIQLPNSRAARAEDKPSRFADAAPGFLLKEMMSKYGVTKGELSISLYGGIDGRGQTDCFRIGEKNLDTVKQAFKQLGLVYAEVDTGGCESRTLVAYVDTGIVEVIKRPMSMGGAARPAAASGTAGTRPGYGNVPQTQQPARPAAASGTRLGYGNMPQTQQPARPGYGARPAAASRPMGTPQSQAQPTRLGFGTQNAPPPDRLIGFNTGAGRERVPMRINLGNPGTGTGR